MSTTELTTSSLIKVAQLPVIEEHLHTVKAQVDATVAEAMSMVCTADTVQSVKSTRSSLNKTFQELEAMRKQVKASVMEPYQQFEAVYKECVADAFKAADENLRDKINLFEDELKVACEEKLRDYFNECCVAANLDFLRYEDCGIKVDMTSAKAKTPKKLMDQIAACVEGCRRDVEMIGKFENAGEIMVEYKKTLNATDAIAIVQDRKAALEREMERDRLRREANQRQADIAASVEAFAPPEIVPDIGEPEPEVLTISFTVRDTRERLIILRNWLRANNYDYN